MDATQLCQFIIDSCGHIYPSPGVTTPKTNRLLPSNSPSSFSTPMIDSVWFSGTSEGLTTYLGPTNFWDN